MVATTFVITLYSVVHRVQLGLSGMVHIAGGSNQKMTQKRQTTLNKV